MYFGEKIKYYINKAIVNSKSERGALFIINAALVVAGISIGQMILNATDYYLDPRLGYKKKNGWCFG